MIRLFAGTPSQILRALITLFGKICRAIMFINAFKRDMAKKMSSGVQQRSQPNDFDPLR